MTAARADLTAVHMLAHASLAWCLHEHGHTARPFWLSCSPEDRSEALALLYDQSELDGMTKDQTDAAIIENFDPSPQLTKWRDREIAAMDQEET